MRLGVGSQCGFTCDVERDEEDKADRGKEEEEGEEEAGGAEAVLMRAEPLMAPAPCLLLLLLWGYCLAVIDGEGELRCYCNESGCVSTGYMCKSPAGQCYTAVEVQGEATRATHGCLDTVPVEERGLCGRQAADKRSEGGGGGGRRHDRARERSELVRGGPGPDGSVSRFPLLICCSEDMCNYIENIDFSSIATLTRTNGTLHRGAGGERGVIYSRNGEREDDDRDLWFKAAVIAVPIAGGFILVLLVLLAVRMLRTDSQRHRRLIQVRRERSLTKAQLYVTDHFSDVGAGKTDAGKGCSLFSPAKTPAENNGHRGGGGCGGGGGVGGVMGVMAGAQGQGVGLKLGLGGPGVGGGGEKPVCRDVNISVDREGRVYEKVQCDVSVHRHSHLPSVVTWGKSSKLDPATVV